MPASALSTKVEAVSSTSKRHPRGATLRRERQKRAQRSSACPVLRHSSSLSPSYYFASASSNSGSPSLLSSLALIIPRFSLALIMSTSSLALIMSRSSLALIIPSIHKMQISSICDQNAIQTTSLTLPPSFIPLHHLLPLHHHYHRHLHPLLPHFSPIIFSQTNPNLARV